MKKKLIKNYSKINLILLVVSVILVIITDFYTFEGKLNNIFFLVMVISFLLSEFFDLLVSENSVSIIILYLNKYSKIFTPLLLLTNIIFLFLYIYSDYLSESFINIFGNVCFVYSFIPPIFRVLFDQEYVQRLTNGRLRRRR